MGIIIEQTPDINNSGTLFFYQLQDVIIYCRLRPLYKIRQFCIIGGASHKQAEKTDNILLEYPRE